MSLKKVWKWRRKPVNLPPFWVRVRLVLSFYQKNIGWSPWKRKILRWIFGLKREEVTGGWRKLHSEELHHLNSSQNIIRVSKSRRMRWVKYVARMGEVGNEHKILDGRPKRRTLGRPRRWLEDNIKVNCQPSCSTEGSVFLTALVTIHFSRKTLLHGVRINKTWRLELKNNIPVFPYTLSDVLLTNSI